MNPSQAADRNVFLAELSAADYELLRPHLTSFSLEAGKRLQRFGAMVEQVVFPHGGLVAMTMPLGRGAGGGAIPIGRDGILGAFAVAAAVPAMCDAEVYVAGRAASMSASAFRHVLDQSATIRRLTGRYTAALMMQAHQTALCNAAHPVEARVARSLLEVLDRCDGMDVPLAQSTLAQMLGVQRTTINLAAGRLQDAGVIKCGRGYMRIAARKQLERHACECYFNIKSYAAHVFALPVGAALSTAPEGVGRKA
jgi:CRP-like cAMP-binding protein